MNGVIDPKDYIAFLARIKNDIQISRVRAAYFDYEFAQALPAQMTWYDNQTIDKNKDTHLKIQSNSSKNGGL